MRRGEKGRESRKVFTLRMERYTIGGLTAGSAIYYLVTSVNAIGESAGKVYEITLPNIGMREIAREGGEKY